MQENCLYLLIFFTSMKQDLFFSSFLVNNVGILPSYIPCRFLEFADLDQVSGTSAVSTSRCPVEFSFKQKKSLESVYIQCYFVKYSVHILEH